jgi:NAD-dependent dihydropyrimidine dehydrogenase PreA subunit
MAAWDKIIICCCAERGWVIPENIKLLCASAKASGVAIELHADFCRTAAEHPEILRKIAESGDALIGGCLNRAMKSIFTAAGSSLPSKFLDLRSAVLTPEKLLELGLEPVEKADTEIELPAADPGWKAWFPVIDRERCVNCGKCLDFCLFGVYEFDAEKRVQVVNPANCKNNCPACARVCPCEAVIFPKYKDPPVNGAEVGGKTSRGDNVFDAKAGDDLYKMLAERKKIARKLFRDKDAKE